MYTRLAQVYRYVLTQIGERVHKHGKVFPGGVVGEWAEAVKSHVMHLQQQQQQGGAGPGFGFDGDLVDVFRRQLGWLAESVVREGGAGRGDG